MVISLITTSFESWYNYGYFNILNTSCFNSLYNLNCLLLIFRPNSVQYLSLQFFTRSPIFTGMVLASTDYHFSRLTRNLLSFCFLKFSESPYLYFIFIQIHLYKILQCHICLLLSDYNQLRFRVK